MPKEIQDQGIESDNGLPEDAQGDIRSFIDEHLADLDAGSGNNVADVIFTAYVGDHPELKANVDDFNATRGAIRRYLKLKRHLVN